MAKEITKIRNKNLNVRKRKLFIDLVSPKYLESLKHTIKDAIRNKKVIEFNYDGHHRIAEPHVHGISNGNYEIETYQLAGGSNRGGIPDWRRIIGVKITTLQVTEQRFKGRRPNTSGKHTPFDEIFDIVDP
ncbi:MAG TPA: hypothetical protein VJS91_09225 [Nitrososphaeraceae archaeon]|nr:hypothetical protein [Nitrososphaeraceae archaeon]